MVTCIDVHLQSGDVSVYWLSLLLDVSAVGVLIVIIAICDMSRQEFSLCEHVYIHNTYIKSVVIVIIAICDMPRQDFSLCECVYIHNMYM